MKNLKVLIETNWRFWTYVDWPVSFDFLSFDVADEKMRILQQKSLKFRWILNTNCKHWDKRKSSFETSGDEKLLVKGWLGSLRFSLWKTKNWSWQNITSQYSKELNDCKRNETINNWNNTIVQRFKDVNQPKRIDESNLSAAISFHVESLNKAAYLASIRTNCFPIVPPPWKKQANFCLSSTPINCQSVLFSPMLNVPVAIETRSSLTSSLQLRHRLRMTGTNDACSAVIQFGPGMNVSSHLTAALTSSLCHFKHDLNFNVHLTPNWISSFSPMSQRSHIILLPPD